MPARLLVALALLLALGPAPLAHADDPVRVVGGRDAAGDVKPTSNTGGLTRKQRRSIDIRVVKVDDLGRKTRFSTTLERITRSKRFDQIVQIQVSPRNWTAGGDGAAALVMSPQEPGGAFTSTSYSDGKYERCRTRARVTHRTVSLVVPNRCLPTTPARIRMQSRTGEFGGDSTTHSRDSFKVPGWHVVR